MLLLLASASDTDELSEILAAGEILRLGNAARDPDIWNSAISAGLVTVRDRRIEFRHPLVRSAIYQMRQSARTRLRAHRPREDAGGRTGPQRVAPRSGNISARRSRWPPRSRLRRTVPKHAVASSSPSKHSNDLPCSHPTQAVAQTGILRAAELALELGDPLAATRLRQQFRDDALGPRSRGRLRLLERNARPAARPMPRALPPRPGSSLMSPTRWLRRVTATSR